MQTVMAQNSNSAVSNQIRNRLKNTSLTYIPEWKKADFTVRGSLVSYLALRRGISDSRAAARSENLGSGLNQPGNRDFTVLAVSPSVTALSICAEMLAQRSSLESGSFVWLYPHAVMSHESGPGF